MSAAELSRFPLLAGLGPEELEAVADFCEREDVVAGVRVFQEGEPANSALFIAEGCVGVRSEGVPGVAEVGAGDVLGTLAIVDRGPRPATAETLSRTRLYRLSRDAFSRLVASEPTIACHMLEELFRESARALREEVQRRPQELDPTPASD